MSPERYQLISDIYLAVSERAPGERAAYLDKLCRGDESLHHEVEVLLASEEQFENFDEIISRKIRSILFRPEDAPNFSETIFEAPAVTETKYCPQCLRNFAITARVCEGDGAVLSLQDPYHLVGQTLDGKYRIEALIGLGGMSAVYRARHLGLDRHMAFKILQPNLLLSDARMLGLFEREARLVARLTHENVVGIKDAGRTSNNIAYIAMEWLDGRTLKEELASHGPLDLERAGNILRQIAAALGASHARRIVHRDLKPANVMLIQHSDGKEHVKVLDFGLAKVIQEATGSSSSLTMGTWHYASPEQFQPGGHVDERSDIYSLGVMLYQMLTGAPPFKAASVQELIQMHLTAIPPALLKKKRPDLPLAIGELIMSMMAKDSNHRPQSVEEVVLRFDAATTISCGSPPNRFFGVSRQTARAIGLLVLAGVVLAIYFLLSSQTDYRSLLESTTTTVKLIDIPPNTETDEVTVVTVDEDGREIDRGKKAVQYYREDLCQGVQLSMVMIPGGKFQMGSPREEADRDNENDEMLHEVIIKDQFFMGQFEVTRAQWRAIALRTDLKKMLDLPVDPSTFKGDEQLPVENINWYEAIEFCQRLTRLSGRYYRLPSESEWEYACRAGTQTPFAFGKTMTPLLANYDWQISYHYGMKKDKSPTGTTKAGAFGLANAFGLYDNHGNVWEYCLDWTDEAREDDYRNDPADGRPRPKTADDYFIIVRGGSWYKPPAQSRSADRGYGKPSTRSVDTGFRVVMAGKLQDWQPVQPCPPFSR